MLYDREAARFWRAARLIRTAPRRSVAHWLARHDLIALKWGARHEPIRHRAARLLALADEQAGRPYRFSSNQ
ncbi:MAG TPA: hypothetical protein VM689_10540 [Aliidongia sp.]|nr:hypothetical protein [Aliidongia sp.]